MQAKVIVPLFKPHSRKRFKQKKAKPFDLEKEIGELPLSQSFQDAETAESIVQDSHGKCKYTKSSNTSKQPAKKKNKRLIDLMENIPECGADDDSSKDYTSPFTDIQQYQN